MDETQSTQSHQASDFNDSASSDSSTSMAKLSCSHCWHGPFYFAMSLTLAYMTLTTIKHSRPENPLPPGHGLALNASQALRLRGGFHITATLLQISPDLFLSGGNETTTVFAIQDSAFSNLSLPPPAMRRLLRRHATPSALPMAELRKKPPGSRLKTLADDDNNSNLVITQNDAATGSIAINNVLITDPDMFLEGPLSVHGVVGPFSPTPTPSPPDQTAVEWTRIIRLLSSKGFVSFAIGLNAVLDKILENYGNLGSVTIFAPPNSRLIASPSPFLDRIVRLHILPRRFSFVDLGEKEKLSVRTLVPSYDLKIEKFSKTVAVDGVEITAPDLFSSESFVIHGISREFDAVELFSSFK